MTQSGLGITETYSWVPLLFLKTGTPQDKAQAQLPPRGELTKLGIGKLLCSCLGPQWHHKWLLAGLSACDQGHIRSWPWYL